MTKTQQKISITDDIQSIPYRHDIVKIIVKRSKYYDSVLNNTEKVENIKLVFIGDVSTNIRRILYKLEINGGEINELDKAEIQLLNNTFPYFATKVGLENDQKNRDYMLKFIYMSISEDVTADNIMMMCLDILHDLNLKDEVKTGEVVAYSYPRELSINQLDVFISYIFFSILDVSLGKSHDSIGGSNQSYYSISGKQFTHALWQLFGIGNKQQSPSDYGLNATDLYKKNDLINNVIIQKTLLSIPIIYGNQRYIDIGYTSKLYYVAGLFNEDIDRLDNSVLQIKNFNRFGKVEVLYNDQPIMYYKNTQNNTIYLELGYDIRNWIKNSKQNLPVYRQLYEQLYEYKIYIQNLQMVNRNRIYMSSMQNNGILNAESYKALQEFTGKQKEYITNDNIIKMDNIEYSNVVFDCFYLEQEYDINLLHMFREIETSAYLPVVKYISHNEPQYYNIYRPFLRNMDDSTRTLFLTGNDNNNILEQALLRAYNNDKIAIRDLLRHDYIILKWHISPGSLLNILIFQNVYTICQYQFIKSVGYSEINRFNMLLNKTIKRIHDFFKLRNLAIPNAAKLFHPTPAIISNCKLLTSNVLYNLHIDNKALYIWYLQHHTNSEITREEFKEQDLANKVVYPTLIQNGLIKYIINHIKSIPTIWTIDTVNDEVRFIYKNTYKFFSTDNIKNFISYMIQQNNRKLTPKEKTNILRNVCNIFNIDMQHAEEIYNSIDLDNINVNEHLIYQTNAHLVINKRQNHINLTIHNITTYNTGNILITIIGNIIKDFMFTTKFNNYLPIIKDANNEFKSRAELAELTSIISSTVLDISITPNTNKIDQPPISLPVDDFLSNLDMDGLDMDGLDMDGLDMDEQLAALEDALGDPEFTKVDDDLDLINKVESNSSLRVKDIKLDPANKKGKYGKKGYNVNAYMMDMYNRFDPKLFNPFVKGAKTDYKYGRSDCPDYTGRRPMVVSKEQLNDIDPESITGYMLYRGNYYICPRIWDAKANRPISVKSFIANGLKSPYTGGKALLEAPNRNAQKHITDEYNVIIRKPSTDRYWSQPELHPEWPKLLKHTEKEAFPGLTFSNKHPNKECVPCCFLNLPDDYDPNKDRLMRRFDRPYNYNKCNYDVRNHNVKPGEDPNNQGNKGAKGVIDIYCNNDEYISGSTSRLKNCRLGLLPNNLDALLNNGQSLFLRPTGNMILDHANLFLRRGIVENPATNILDTFANIMEKPTESVINTIVSKLTPVDMLTMYNGELIDMFCSSEELPTVADNNETGIGSIKKFVKFLEIYPALIEYFAADMSQVIDYILNERWLRGSAQERVDTIIRDSGSKHTLEPELLALIKLLYKIMTAFYNYISYLASPKEVKSPEHVIELFTQPRSWPGFFKQGLNVIIFDSAINSIKCLNTFNYKVTKLAIFIQEGPSYYIPIFHVINRHGKMSSTGIITLNNSVNLDNLILGVISRKNPKQITYINTIKDRLSPLVRLLYIQSELCNYNISYFTNRLQLKFKPKKTEKNSKTDSKKDNSTDNSALGSLITTQYIDIGGAPQVTYVKIQIDSEHILSNTSKDKSNKRRKTPKNIEELILPVYPRYLIKSIPVFNYYRLHEDINNIGMTIYKLLSAIYNIGPNSNAPANILKNKNTFDMSREWETLYSLDYHIEKIFIEPVINIVNNTHNKKLDNGKQIMITGVQFYNGLTISLVPTVYDREEIDTLQDYIYKIYNAKFTVEHHIVPNLLKDTLIIPLTQHLDNDKDQHIPTKIKDTIIKDEFFNDVIHGLDLLNNIIKSKLSAEIFKMRGSEGPIKDLIKYLIDSTRYIQDDKVYYLLDKVLRKYIIKMDPNMNMYDFVNSVYRLSSWKNTTKMHITGTHQYTRKIARNACTTGKKQHGKGRTIKLRDGVIYGGSSNTKHNKKYNKGSEINLCFKDEKTGVNLITLPKHIYIWVLYNVGKDLVYDKTQLDLVITGKYIVPMGDNPLTKIMKDVYNVSEKVGIRGVDDSVILSVDELAQYILSNNISKYRRNYKIKNPRETDNIKKVYADGMGRPIHLSDEDVKRMSELIIDHIETRIVSGLSSVFMDITSAISSINTHKIIKTTVFNSEGIYNPMAYSGDCVFPYRSRVGGLSYNCLPARDVMQADALKKAGLHKNELICPTETLRNKKVVKWGYCPEDPKVSTERMTTRNTRAIDAYKYVGKNMPKRVGYCEFPFIYYDNTKNNPIVNPDSRSSPFIKIAFDCVDDNVTSGSWCYVKTNMDYKNDKVSAPDLLIGTKKKTNIYYGKWNMDSIYKHKTTGNIPSITQRAITNIHDKMGLKRADCNIKDDPTLRKRIEKGLGLDNVQRIKFDEYIPDKCMLSESKKGYTKKQLYLFGRDELSINYNLMLNKNRRIINKSELCEMFNRKIREMRKGEKIGKIVDSANKRQIYNKDPEKCLLGPSKGGYSLTELRDIAITHFALTESKALQMNKSQLCDYIIPQLDSNVSSNDDGISSQPRSLSGSKATVLEELQMEKGDLYPRDKHIDNCANSRGRGGLSKKQAVAVASRLNISTEGQHKDTLCKLIKDKIQQYKESGYDTGAKKIIDVSKDNFKADILNKISKESTTMENYMEGTTSDNYKQTVSDTSTIDDITF